MDMRRALAGSGPSLGRRRAHWALSRQAFERLLATLDGDPDRAADRYEELRSKLIVFFSARGCSAAEDQADVALDRVSRRLDDGTEVRDVGRFAYGVARLVLAEWVRRDRRHRHALRGIVGGHAAARTVVETEAGLECLRRCALGLEPAERGLILAYYDSMGRDGQRARKDLAQRLGLTAVGLRVRAHRIRRALEACTRRCLAGDGVAAGPAAGRRR
jgi:DNA-directed RNA polymerase specialized sigma24 family protein